MKSLKQVLGGDLRQYTMIGALIVLLIGFHFGSGGRMLTPSNIQALVNANSYVLVLAIGMVMVIIVGHIDLSVGSVAGFVGMVIAKSAADFSLPWWVALLLGLLVGALIGSWHGFWLAKVGIPGFIVTLAGMMIFRGLVLIISKSVSVPAPPEFRTIGAGYLPEWGPAFTNMNNSTLLLGLIAIAAVVYSEFSKRRKLAKLEVELPPVWTAAVRAGVLSIVIAYFTYLFGSGKPGTSFPVPGLILIALVIVYHVITQRTSFGRAVYAVGGNRAAAALSGVNVKRTYFLVMANMSFLAAVAGILFLGRSTSAGPNDGNTWELDAIAAVFIGGAAVSGGVGTVIGSMVGGLVMAVLNSGLSLMSVGADRTQFIKGLVLLAAVAFDVYNKQQGRPSIIGRLFGNKDTALEEEDLPEAAVPVAEAVEPGPQIAPITSVNQEGPGDSATR